MVQANITHWECDKLSHKDTGLPWQPFQSRGPAVSCFTHSLFLAETSVRNSSGSNYRRNYNDTIDPHKVLQKGLFTGIGADHRINNFNITLDDSCPGLDKS